MSAKSKKKPLVRSVPVHVDDDTVAALEEAREALQDAEKRADDTYQRRLSVARRPNVTAEELLKVEDGLTQERETSLAPFREAVQQAEEAARAAAEFYVFRSLGHRRYEDLVAEHPPTEEDHDRIRKLTGQPEALAGWGMGFEPALVARACVGNAVSMEEAEALAKAPPGRDAEPVMSVEEATELRDEWTDAEWQALVQAAFIVSRGVRQVDLGKASRAATARA